MTTQLQSIMNHLAVHHFTQSDALCEDARGDVSISLSVCAKVEHDRLKELMAELGYLLIEKNTITMSSPDAYSAAYRYKKFS